MLITSTPSLRAGPARALQVLPACPHHILQLKEPVGPAANLTAHSVAVKVHPGKRDKPKSLLSALMWLVVFSPSSAAHTYFNHTTCPKSTASRACCRGGASSSTRSITQTTLNGTLTDHIRIVNSLCLSGLPSACVAVLVTLESPTADSCGDACGV